MSVYRMILALSNVLILHGVAKPSEQSVLRSQIICPCEPLTSWYENLIAEISRLHFRNSQKNLIIMSNDYISCNRIVKILMDESPQGFFIGSATELTIMPHLGDSSAVAHYSVVTFLAKNADEISIQFEDLRQHCSWNPRAKHLAVIFEDTSEKDLVQLFNEFWTHKVLNVGVTVYNREETYTYNRYLNHSIEKVDAPDLFYDKLRDMMGHPIRATYVPYLHKNGVRWNHRDKRYVFLGRDWGFAHAFFKIVNATAIFFDLTNERVRLFREMPYRMNYFKKQTFADAELSFNTMGAEFEFSERIEKAYPFGMDSICLLAPKSGLRVPNIFEPYTKITWIFIITSFLIYSIYSQIYYKFVGIAMNAFIVSLKIFLGKDFRTINLSAREKWTFIMWTFYSLLLINSYQGSLYRTLATISYKPEINSLGEIFQKRSVIYAYSSIYDIVRKYVPSNITVRNLHASEVVKTMKTMQQAVYVNTLESVAFAVKRTRNSENGIPLYHLVEECLVPMHMTFALPYGSPYLRKLDKAIITCREAGLDQYWSSEGNLNAILTGEIIEYVEQLRTLEVLSLRTQLYGFFLWGLGLAISALCCLVEVYWDRVSSRIRFFVSRMKRLKVMW